MSSELVPLDSPSRDFAGGALRPTNPRLHAVASPYTRQAAGGGLTSTRAANGLPRSGSESSLGLLGGLRSMISKPFSWLSTPSKERERHVQPTPPQALPSAPSFTFASATKRDHSLDPEDPDSSPLATPAKRVRRKSPTTSPGKYVPRANSFDVVGRAVTGTMIRPSGADIIPPLPSNLSLSRRQSRAGSTTNFSRPLPNSRSMPYLDPPSLALSPARTRRSGMLTRSRRMDLAAEATDDESGSQMEVLASPNQKSTPRKAEAVLPSNSPFRIGSPSRPAPLAHSSLARSNTLGHLGRRQSVATDVSMGSGVRRSGSLLFGQPARVVDDRMSVDSRDGSVTDWFMKDRWNNRDSGLTPGRAAALRSSGSTFGPSSPTSAFPPIRRGQLVWDSDKGFVRESELRAADPGPVGSNEAERILFALENRKTTPLQSARQSATPFSQGGPFPAELVGASTRQIRKAINVPLTTAQGTESRRNRRERELQQERERGVSVIISPYGRRKQAEEQRREHRRERVGREDHEDSEYVPSADSLLSPRSERASRRSSSIPSQVSDLDMTDAENVPPTPRRSARLRKGSADVETTPKASRKGKARAPPTKKKAVLAERTSPETPRRHTRRSADRKSPSPPAPTAATPSVPTILETAPSPQQPTYSSTYAPRADGDVSRDRSSLRAGADKTKRTHAGAASFSSRANTPGSGRFSAREEDLPQMEDLEQSKIPANSFAGISFAGLSAAPTPSTTPPASLPPTPAEPAVPETSSLAGRLGPKPAAEQPTSSLNVPGRGPLSRLHQPNRPRSSSPLASGSIVAQPDSPEQPKFGAKAKSPEPAPVSTPASSDGFVPLSTPSISTTPAGKPPAQSFFTGFGTAPSSTSSSLFGDVAAPKKTSGLGIGKPSEEKKTDAAEGTKVPDFFGKSAAPSGTTTPTPTSSGFNFGVSAPAPVAAPLQPTLTSDKPTGGFSFGASDSTTPASAGFSFGAKSADASDKAAEAPKTGFSFGAPSEKKDEASKSSFSFGAPSPAAEKKDDQAAKPVFSFGSSSSTPAPAPAATATETPKPSFSFGAPAEKKDEAPKSTFSFGAPAEKKDEAPASKPAFSFGAPSAAPAAAPEKKDEAAKPAFSFGSSSAAAPASTGFSFGKPAETKDTSSAPAFGTSTPASTAPASTGFSFGSKPATAAPAANGNGTNGFSFGSSTGGGFGSSTTASSNKRSADDNNGEPPAKSAAPPSSGFSFGSSSGSTAQPSSGAFGSSTSTTSAPFTFGASASTPAAQPASNPFGSSTSSTNTPFTFGSGGTNAPPASTSAPSNPFGSGSSAPAASTGGAGSNSGFTFTFGGSNTGAASSTPASTSAPFQFGASGSTPSSGGFGTANGGGGGFGSGTTNTNNAASSSGFGSSSNGFGTSNGGGFGSSTTNTSGGFGQPAQQAASNPFGSSAPTSTTSFGGFGTSAPSAQATQPSSFAFGSPAPSTPTNGAFVFGAGGNNGASSGSPAPGSGGGFSLGSAAGGPPGSPSGRIIKPLRKAKR